MTEARRVCCSAKDIRSGAGPRGLTEAFKEGGPIIWGPEPLFQDQQVGAAHVLQRRPSREIDLVEHRPRVNSRPSARPKPDGEIGIFGGRVDVAVDDLDGQVQFRKIMPPDRIARQHESRCRRRGQANRHEVASGAEGDLGEASLDGAEPPLDRRLQGLASLGQGNGTPEPFEKQASQMTL